MPLPDRRVERDLHGVPKPIGPHGQPVCCEKCGSTNLEFDGWDIDKCRDCGHWRYR